MEGEACRLLAVICTAASWSHTSEQLFSSHLACHLPGMRDLAQVCSLASSCFERRLG